MFAQYKSVDIREKQITENLMYKHTILIQVSITIPELLSQSFQQPVSRINRHYESKASAFFHYCKTKLYNLAVSNYEYSQKNQLPFHPYEASLHYTAAFNQHCIISIYFDRSEYTGGAHNSTYRFSDSWFIPYGKKLSLAALFPSCTNYKEILLQEIFKETDKNPAIYYEDVHNKIFSTFDQAQFYLRREDLSIYFQEYDIAPYSLGIPEFNLPYDALDIRLPKC